MNTFSRRSIPTRMLAICSTLAAFWAAQPAARADRVFVENFYAGTIGEYSATGTAINASLITGLDQPECLAVSGNTLFVSTNVGTIGTYTTAGATVNPNFLTGLNYPLGLAVAGSNLYVVNFGSGTVSQYTTSGTLVNPSLITGLVRANGIAITGSNIFVSSSGPSDTTGEVGEYTLTGATVNASLITGLGPQPLDLVASGSNLFIDVSGDSDGQGTIVEYTNSGQFVETIASGLDIPQHLVTWGSDLLVTSGNSATGRVGEYSMSGGTINSTFISGLAWPTGLAVVPDIPEPASLMLLAVGSISLFRHRRRLAST